MRSRFLLPGDAGAGGKTSVKEGRDGARSYWEPLCGLSMGVALVGALISLILTLACEEAGGMDGWFYALCFAMWAFAGVGLVLCYLNNAKGRRPMAIAGVGGSALGYACQAIACGSGMRTRCASPAGFYGSAAIVCAFILFLLLEFSKQENRMSPMVRVITGWIARLLMAAWLAVLLFFGANCFLWWIL